MLLLKHTTIQEALQNHEIIMQKTIFPSEEIYINGGDYNFYLKDIFGNHHKAFRPYRHKTQEFNVYMLPNAYCFSNQEIILTQSKKFLIEQTSCKTHPLFYQSLKAQKAKKPEGGGARVFINSLFPLYKNIKTRFKLLFAKNIHANVALLTRPDIENCYGHLIADVAFNLYQIQQFERLTNIKIDYYILPNSKSFQKELIKIFNIPTRKIISSCLSITLRAKNIIIPTLTKDYEFIEYRGYLHYRTNAFHSAIAKIFDSFKPKNIKPHKKIFLKRPENSNRLIENNHEVEEIFKSFGYEIVFPDILNFKQIIELFSQVICIASLHGSGLDNILFANDEIYVFEIFSQYYFDNSPQLKALLKHCRYSYLVGETPDTSMHPQKENVYINPQALKTALKILETHLST
ncbi:glycosyltransferase family 61 protein [Helicobacter anatolicus]|uniref:glycosyltransferase family 61 protein n=1 Tax=Helicobacter anatolicus TaxID=2905874 RepID=UPI001E403FD6|nr:glycosyltransferase family 61 protein [Helicobacter anatolicus]MCE3038034.1 glycosyltransferase family 61 protein [Helicobacter anatolicus]